MKKCISQEWENVVKKHAVDALIVDVFGEDGSGSAILEISGLKLRCDLPYFRCEGWEDMTTSGPNRNLIGKKIKVILSLLYLEKPEKGSMKKRRIEQVATEYIPAEYSTWYEVEGMVKEVHDEFWVVDCGITVIVDRATSENYSVGDWLAARGRLDAYLVEEG